MSLQNIPPELRLLNQWVAAGPDKVPLTPRTGQPADVTNPATWGTFNEACTSGYKHVGFVFAETDPYAFIDLDAPVTPEQADRHSAILRTAESYSELSQSGAGVHIVVRGAIPHGVRRDKVEVYSSGRYAIFTGALLNALPIAGRQELLDALYHQMDSTKAGVLVEQDETLSDAQVAEMASAAVNGAKFERLWAGEWEGDPLYPSQSEADFALMAMLCFYSHSNEQCRRLFRLSALGKRDKSMRNKYLDYMIAKCRAKEPPPADLKEIYERTQNYTHVYGTPEQVLKGEGTLGWGPPAENKLVTTERSGCDPDTAVETEHPNARYAWQNPPGFIGELAEYFFSAAIRPVPEIALASAIALGAGVVGRSYNISGTGLNQYLVLLAKTGSGKEGAASSIDSIIAAVRRTVPAADTFVGPAAFASGQALVRVLDAKPCFVSVLGEFGHTLAELNDPRAAAATTRLKQCLLDLYTKSGWTKVLRPSVYSDTDKNTGLIQAPSVTMLGESTPDKFYDALDTRQILEGLVPRFSIIEYLGPRPARNRNAFQDPPKDIADRLIRLLTIALTTRQNNTCCPVQCDASALKALDDFDVYADGQINSGGEVEKNLWNRAHLKALKLSALVAVGCNPDQPIVTKACADWAMAFVANDVALLQAKFAAGDIGQGQSKQEADIRYAICEYLKMTAKHRAQYKTPVSLSKEPLVPFHYLRRRLRMTASYANDKRGPTPAIEAMLDQLIKVEVLVQLNRQQVSELYGVTQPVYGLGRNW